MKVTRLDRRTQAGEETDGWTWVVGTDLYRTNHEGEGLWQYQTDTWQQVLGVDEFSLREESPDKATVLRRLVSEHSWSADEVAASSATHT